MTCTDDTETTVHRHANLCALAYLGGLAHPEPLGPRDTWGLAK